MPGLRERCPTCSGAHDRGASCPGLAGRIGQVIANTYRVTGMLGQGSMGSVFEAVHLRVGRRVAIKFLHPELARSKDIMARFEREAQAAGALENEHIAAATDFGYAKDGAPFIIMEYLQGEDVGKLLKRVGPLPVARATELLLQVCRGLGAAHASGIVHRDLKPENLFVCRRADGTDWVKILDFGVAKLRRQDVSSESVASGTRVGALMGTPMYMAPEHVRSSKDVDERADIYALGVILYELLAGQTPHVAATYEQLLFKIMNETPARLETVRKGLPAMMDWVVRKAMAHDPSERFASVADLAATLAPFAESGMHGSRPTIEIALSRPDEDPTRVERQSVRIRAESTPDVDVDLANLAHDTTQFEPKRARPDSTPPPPTSFVFPTGRDLGKYKLILRLARGGMGDVHLAAHDGPGGFLKLVVVKELRTSLGEESSSLGMFLDEARLAARLSHTNVVQTLEVSSQEQHHFMVMEYLEGQALHRILKRRPPQDTRALIMYIRVLCDALKGLHHAHEAKEYDGSPLDVVHRDFTPHNVFVTYDGVVKVLDFGIAKAVDSQDTRTGIVKGKARYMAPEQAMGGKVDRRADVYSAGVILWETLTGRRLWHGLSDVQILLNLTKEAAPHPDEVNPEAPLSLVRTCMRALARDPRERFATAEELRLELEAWLAGERQKGLVSADLGATVREAFVEERKKIDTAVEEALRKMRSLDPLPPPRKSSRSKLASDDLRDQRGPSRRTPGTPVPAMAAPAPVRDTTARRPIRAARTAFLGVVLALVAASIFVLVRKWRNGADAAALVASNAASAAVMHMPAPSAAPTETAPPIVATAALPALPPSAMAEAARPSGVRATVDERRARHASHTAHATEAESNESAAQAPATTPPPGPVPTGVMSFSGEMVRPTLLSGHEPVYTAEARNAKVEGTMVVKCVITVAGAVESCKPLKTLPLMESAVIDALTSRRYTPVLWEGRPVAVSYVFNLKLTPPP